MSEPAKSQEQSILGLAPFISLAEILGAESEEKRRQLAPTTSAPPGASSSRTPRQKSSRSSTCPSTLHATTSDARPATRAISRASGSLKNSDTVGTPRAAAITATLPAGSTPNSRTSRRSIEASAVPSLDPISTINPPGVTNRRAALLIRAAKCSAIRRELLVKKRYER